MVLIDLKSGELINAVTIVTNEGEVVASMASDETLLKAGYKKASKRELKKREIGAAAMAELKEKIGGLEVEGVGVINAGERHLQNITALLSILEGDSVLDFRMYNNTFIKVDRATLLKMQRALILAANEVYAKKWKLEAQIDSVKNEEQLSWIEW